MFELHYAYNVAVNDDGATFRVVPSSQEEPGRHCVIRFKGPSPRFAMVDSWRTTSREEALDTIVAPAFQPFRRVLLSTPDGVEAPPLDRDGGTGLIGEIDVRRFKPGAVSLRVARLFPRCTLAGSGPRAVHRREQRRGNESRFDVDSNWRRRRKRQRPLSPVTMRTGW